MIVYRLSPHTNINTDFTLKNCLFGADKLTKNADIDKYKYSGYGIGFNSRGTFAHSNGDYGVNLIIFGCNLKNSVHANNRKNNILILGKSLVQGLTLSLLGFFMYVKQLEWGKITPPE